MKIALPTLPNPGLIRLYLIIFSVFFYNCSLAQAPAPQTGKGYMNITKGTTGGTFEAGDVLEIRSTFSMSGGTFGYVRYIDTIPAGMTYVPGSMKLMSNEGQSYKSYTDNADTDGGVFKTSDKTLKMHMAAKGGPAGNQAVSTDPNVDAANAPFVNNTLQPSFYTSTLIMVASYRVTVDNAAVNTVITSKGGAFYYSYNSTAKVAALPSFKMRIAPNLGLCSNKVTSISALENNGTFASGNAKNRTTSLTGFTTTYTKMNLSSSPTAPNDGQYSIVNNTTGNNSTNNSISYSGNSQRIFGVWEITGDHSGATNTAQGNNPTAIGSNGGYMLVVNASYVNGTAVSLPASNLCDETYYEFSAWFKNICKYCGCDITGKGAFENGYVPYRTGDSSGVQPNLTFEVNGESLYTTGDIAFSGQWVKKGFIFKTKPGETSVTLSIRNNSSGGGGNDWAMDDLSFSICGPGISVTPTRLTDCNNNYINMAATVRYFQQNYGAYIWEKSTNNGAFVPTNVTGTITPQLVGGQYEYTVNYPPLLTTPADDGTKYRLRVASNAGNLVGNTCSYIDTTVASLTIFDCQVLPVDFLSFNGNTVSKKNTLYWSTQREVNPSSYTLERSWDAVNFTNVTALNSQNLAGVNSYRYTDPLVSDRRTYYRILIKDLTTQKTKYTGIVTLNGSADDRPSTINILENPFSDVITMDVFAGQAETLNIHLYDVYGRIIRSANYPVEAGFRKLKLDGLGNFTPGFYLLKIRMGNQMISRKMVKQ